MIAPHGGRLVNQVLNGEVRSDWITRATDLPSQSAGRCRRGHQLIALTR